MPSKSVLFPVVLRSGSIATIFLLTIDFVWRFDLNRAFDTGRKIGDDPVKAIGVNAADVAQNIAVQRK